MTMERYLLKELGFSFYDIIEHPHKYLLYYVKVLNGNEELAQRAWNYLNDSMRLDLCLRYETATITCCAVYMASEDLHFALPSGQTVDSSGGETAPAWWTVFGASLDTIATIKQAMLELYAMPKVFCSISMS